MPNRDANKGKNSMSVGYEKLYQTPLWFKCGGHDDYDVTLK